MLSRKKLKPGQLVAENPLFDCFHSVARRFLTWPLDGAAHLLFEEITSKFPNMNALAVNLQSHEVVLTSSPFQNVVSQFLGKDVFYSLSDLEFMFKNHHELVELLTNQPSNFSSTTTADGNFHRHQKIVELVLVDDDKCRCFIDIMFIGSISLSTLRFHRFPLNSCDDDYELSYGDEYVTEDEDVSLVEASHSQCAMIDKHLHSGGIMRPRAPLSQISLADSVIGGVGTGAKKYHDICKRPPESGAHFRNADVMKRLQSTSSAVSKSNYSSSSISLQRACGTFLLTSDKRQIPYQVGCNLSPSPHIKSESSICENFDSLLLEKDGLELFTDIQNDGSSSREPIVNIVYSGGLYATWSSSSKQKSSPVLSSIANEAAPTLVSAITTVDIAPYIRIPQQPSTPPNVPLSFESILQSFLRVIPFHVVEIWVPVQLTNNSTVLLYGASGALDKDLHGWSSYSRNFSFNPDVGLPGRVATARTAESQTDVAKLPMPTFLRAEMAGSLGIHAACGLPFFTGNKCDAVVVFYSRHIFEPTPSLIEYMSNLCESVNIRAQIRVLKA